MSEWIDCDEQWAYWINPETFRMPRVKGRVPLGVVVVVKSREEEDGRSFVQTQYSVATSEGLQGLEGKREASEKLAEQMLAYMQRTGSYPPGTHIKKAHKNGNVDLSYAPGDYDTFTLRLSPALVGQDPILLLDSLTEFVEQASPQVKPWRVETAPSGRSTCRSCGEKIARGELRLGFADASGDYDVYRWHHLHCAAGRINDPEALIGFAELTDQLQQQVRESVQF